MADKVANIDFLFRFRDLVAPTIDEHQKTINEHGACWWGWWKRPSEDSRHALWAELAAAVKRNGAQEIGLFDSGTDQVRIATVIDIVEPYDEQGSSQLVDVPNGERELVPIYYRQSPFSRAWMKLSKIGEPIDFFSKYSYAEAPSLPNYTPVTLKKFVGKRILSADELRGMDTTIWKIRPAEPSDADKAMILGVPALPTAISAEPVKCNSNVVLHITDPHFAKGIHRSHHVWRLETEVDGDVAKPTLVEVIHRALKGRTIGLIVVTGDLTFMGTPEEYVEARKSLTRLLGLFDLGPDHLIVIPGNHDIVWSAEDEYKYDAEVKNASEFAKKNYKDFYQMLFQHDPNLHLSMGRRFLLPSGLALEVCGLNSSSLETGKNFLAGMGRIQEASFEEVATDLGWTTDLKTFALRILAVHHHLALTEDLENANDYSRGYGIAVDAVRIQRMAASYGVQLALHGHKHRSFIWRSSIYELPEQTKRRYKLGDLSIVGGGSAGSKETDGESNYFNLLEFSPAGLELDIWRSVRRGVFSSIQKWKALLTIDEKEQKLMLDDWLPVSES
ncbi:metallophosphoesterase family protein [Mycolicibacterium porcinum]|uniref:Metallophosphoesterase n=1 Tax=Mycolicibacterium porcinum TaxID=39693 RepID=A0AAW5T8Z8_9MYCO|nr:metallophosphoesterase [Mycolicibacterium porcinum]MCV7391136.1 metallophosphoesterase [Mycolicibacterium porcinum]CDO33209.1 Calcineurin-like phosphoesterase [Mycolicibacterium vulneris]